MIGRGMVPPLQATWIWCIRRHDRTPFTGQPTFIPATALIELIVDWKRRTQHKTGAKRYGNSAAHW